MTEHSTPPLSITSRYRAILQSLSGLLLVCAISQSQTALAAEGGLVNPDHVAEHWTLPERAIDSQQIPEYKLDADAADSHPLPVYRLRDNSYFLFGSIDTLDKDNRGWNGNAGFVVTEAGVVVIDSLGTPLLGQRLIATIRSITDQPIKYLIITHNHPDHAYGTNAFRQLDGITIIAHQGTIEYNHSATLQSSVDYRQQMLARDMKGFEPVTADIYIKPPPFRQQEIKLGDSHFYIYNTGSHHSYGDLVVHQPEQKILWVSDLVFNQRTTYMGDGDSAQILKAQDWLLKTFPDIELMVPGHGSAQTPPFPMLKQTHDYVSRMRAAMRKAVEEGISLSDAVQRVEFPDWQGVRLYEQNQRANANFVYREMEKEFFENF